MSIANKPEAPDPPILDALSSLLRPSEARRKHFFHIYPSDASFDWGIRRHRQRLVAAGALVIINGQKWVEPVRFADEMFVIGREIAERDA